MKVKLAIWIINLGVKLLPDEYRNKIFIDNCIAIKIINLDKDK